MNHAKDLINKLCNEQNAGSGVETISCILIPPAGTNGYPPYLEIMVPGSKVGLVIGKGGETIKMLQEKTGAKMVIIQDGPGQELVIILIIFSVISRVKSVEINHKFHVFFFVFRKNHYEFRAIQAKLNMLSS